MLEAFRQDELDHRNEALEGLGNEAPGSMLQVWCSMVGQGSAIAVRLAKLI
jgi:demethoxyubiquinone hydroxylase (CLK1/Coq7/Cat5 family)